MGRRGTQTKTRTKVGAQVAVATAATLGAIALGILVGNLLSGNKLLGNNAKMGSRGIAVPVEMGENGQEMGDSESGCCGSGMGFRTDSPGCAGICGSRWKNEGGSWWTSSKRADSTWTKWTKSGKPYMEN